MLYTKTMFKPNELRAKILRMAYRGQSVHIPCAFSLVEIVSVLFQEHLHFQPDSPESPERDRLILSKGHGVMALYACFHELGWLSDQDLDDYFKDGSRLRGLCESNIPGLEVTSGSLGHGLPIAVGVALGLKRLRKKNRVFCIVGDGELNEGPMWESLLFADQHQLSNLYVIVDANQFQAMGRTNEILNLEPLAEKFRAFGFECHDIDGHDTNVLNQTFRILHQSPKPKAVVARTIKGKGVPFMEGQNHWHYTRLDEATYQASLKSL